MPAKTMSNVRRAPRDKAGSTSAARVRRFRAKQRAAGFKLVQMWVPDTSDPALVADIRRQCLSLRNDPQEQRILAEIESTADLRGWK